MRLLHFTGEPMTAQQALTVQFVQAVHPDHDALTEARTLAATVTS